MDERNGRPGLGAGLLLAAALLWGTVGPAQVAAADPIAPAALGGWRLLVGGVILGAYTLGRDPRRLRALARRSLVRPLLICGLSTGLYQAVFLSAVARTGAALATVITLGSVPAATGLCARWVNHERMGAGWLLGTVAAVAGCALLFAPGGGSRIDPFGLLLSIAAGTCYALYTVFAKQVTVAEPDVDLPTLSALSLLTGALVLLPWMIGDAGALGRGSTLALIAWLGTATTALPYLLYSVGLRRVRATTAGTLSLGEPLSAAVLGVLLLHEHLSAAAWAGCALILAGMVTMCLPWAGGADRIGATDGAADAVTGTADVVSGTGDAATAVDRAIPVDQPVYVPVPDR
jgi:DME family drug/metabolite transporter